MTELPTLPIPEQLDYNDRSWWEPLQVDWPQVRLDDWSLERFTVGEEAAYLYNFACLADVASRTMSGFDNEHLKAVMNGAGIVSGTFTRLVHEGTGVFMSDTPKEIGEHFDFLGEAYGRVLVTGLGLGMVVRTMMEFDLPAGRVSRVTVVEKSEEVVKLVGTHLKRRYGDRVEIITGDAFTVDIDGHDHRWDCAWHDIWPTICEDNLSEMETLTERFLPYVADFQTCWAEDKCLAMRRHIEMLENEVKKAGKWEEYQRYLSEREGS